MAERVSRQPEPAILLGCAALAAIDIAGPLLPESEGEIVFGIIAAALVVGAAAALWSGRRWAATALIVVAALHVLVDAPAIFVADTLFLKLVAAAAVAIAVALILLVRRARASRPASAV